MLTWDQELAAQNLHANYQIICRNGSVAPFKPSKVERAMMQLLLAIRATNHVVQTKPPIFYCAQACSAIQTVRRPALDGLGVRIKQHLLSLFKLKDRTALVWATKLSGFFSANKANLRNAP
jgi:hypothetical protein